MSYTINNTMATVPVYTSNVTNGTYLTVGATGSTSINWSNLSTITGSSTSLTGHTLEVKGDANITGDTNIAGELTIKGKKLSEVLENIESRLAILHPNEKLEEKWENLRGLREAYVALEKEIIEKEAMWAILKR
jgi:hypothetical protein